MSTRCQVQVIDEEENKITLYHHCDGYMENMVPLMRKGFEESSRDWKIGRAGKAAAFLCAADPGGFDIEEGHDLHSDIEYLYRFYCITKQTGSTDHPKWEIEVWVPKPGFWDNADMKHMKKIVKRIDIMKAPEEKPK